MSGFGEALRRERETRGISLDALSAETKVQSRHFLALEQDAFANLPGGVFRRGILRAYLRALHLEEQAWIRLFEASVAESVARGDLALHPQEEAWKTFAEHVRKNRSEARRRFDWRWFGIGPIFGTVAAVSWAVWHFERHALVGR